MKIVLLVIALVLAVLAAVLAFSWFGADPEVLDILGVLALSLASYFGSLLAPR